MQYLHLTSGHPSPNVSSLIGKVDVDVIRRDQKTLENVAMCHHHHIPVI